MARTKAPPPPQVFTELIASAHRVDLKSAREAQRAQSQKTRPWQQEAWQSYEQIGEVWEAHNYVANAMARVRLYPAIQENPAEPPVALDPEPEEGSADPRAIPAVEELARIQSRIGGQAQILSDYALNIGVAGECYLVGHTITDEGGLDVDEWGIYSTDQIKVDGTKWKIVSGPQDREGEVLDPETTVLVRLWQRHPRFKNDPDSAMRAVLGVCEELLLLTQKIRGQALSALNNGLLLIDDSIVPGGTDKEKFVESIIAAITAPLSDPDSPFTVAPNIITATGGDAGLDKKMLRLTFDRVTDESDIKRREELLGRLANGLDLPREVILGLSSSPFSRTAWQIDEQTAKAHIEPKAVILASSITSAILRSALRDRGVDGWEDVVCWYDLGDIVGAPNESEEAKWAYDKALISASRTRRALGFGDDDAPEVPKELVNPITANVGAPTMTFAQLMTINEARADYGLPPVDDGDRMMTVEEIRALRGSDNPAMAASASNGGGASHAHPILHLEPIALAASPRDRTIATLGARLSDMDRMLRGQLQAAADAAMTRALDRAGARLRQKMKGEPKMRARMSNADNAHLVSVLGPVIVAASGFSDDDLLADSFEELHPRYDAWVLRTQKRSTDAARDLDAEIDEPSLAVRQREDREAGWLALQGGLLATARKRLYDPDPVAPPQGEFDPNTRVPAGIVRGALSRAGGAEGQLARGGAALDAMGHPQGELATGPRVMGLLKRAGVAVATRTWSHSGLDPMQLDSHYLLDGETFESWDDPVLSNPDEFPDVDLLFPGDHDGCGCSVMLQLSSGKEITEEG